MSLGQKFKWKTILGQVSEASARSNTQVDLSNPTSCSLIGQMAAVTHQHFPSPCLCMSSSDLTSWRMSEEQTPPPCRTVTWTERSMFSVVVLVLVCQPR